MIKDKVDRGVLMEGNFVNIHRVTTEKVETLVSRYSSNLDGEFGGIRISFDRLKSLLGFEEQRRRDANGQLTSGAIISLEIEKDKYYIIRVDLVDGGYSMTILLEGNVVSSSKVVFIHQVQSIVATLTGKDI